MKKTKEVLERYKEIGVIIWSYIGILILVIFFLYILSLISSILLPFVYAMALVYILRPFVNFFEKKGLNRAVSLILIYLVLALIVTIFLFYLVPALSYQFSQFLKNFPLYLKAVQGFLKTWQGKFTRLRIPKEAVKLFEEGIQNLQNWIVSALTRLPRVSINLVSNLFYLILAPVIAFYILKDLKAITETAFALVPVRYREEAKVIAKKIDTVLGSFIKGQFLVALSVGILTSIGLSVIRVDYAIVIGMITGVLNIIPYFGPVVGALLAGIVGLFRSPLTALWAVLVLLIVQQIDSLFLTPNIMRKQVSLHPVLIVFSLLTGGVLFGVMGMLLAIPVAAVGKVLIYHFVEKYEEHF